MICSKCGWREAEPGFSKCWTCLQNQRENREIAIRKEAIEKERAERKKPKETVDDIACKARKMGLTYGKYLSMREMGQIKEDEDE